MSELKEGAIVSGEVISTKPFGAFVKLETGETGLIHISQVSTSYIDKVEDVLTAGATVQAKIISIDPTGKISLSIKALSAGEDRPYRERKGNTDRRGGSGARNNKGAGVGDFEDMVKKWMKSSEERLSAITAKQKKNR